MEQNTFKALILEQQDGEVRATVQERGRDELPEGDVLVSVAYSTLNYKDGLAVTGSGKIVRSYPFVPGIDFAGTVLESASPSYQPGDQVLLTGWGMGERHWGGFAQLARVKADWLVPLPEGLSLRRAMGIGTAGFTAMLCVMALQERGLHPGGRDVVVTGAAGGVGSVAVSLLARLGCTVVASTGRADAHDYLRSLGAREMIDREVLSAASNRPMESERWGGAVDTVGGATLAGLLRGMAYGSSVAACGLAGGTDLHATVLPFILRGVSILGVESVMCPQERRRAAWTRLAQELPAETLERMIQEIPLGRVPELSRAILRGEVRGRVVVDLSA